MKEILQERKTWSIGKIERTERLIRWDLEIGYLSLLWGFLSSKRERERERERESGLVVHC